MAGAEDEAGQEQTKSSGRAQWRDRLKDKANKLTKPRSQSAQHDKDVADFLRPSSSSTSASTEHIQSYPQQNYQQQQQQQQQQQYSQHAPARPIPRIDTGALQQWSSVAPEDRLEPLGFPAPQVMKKRRPKPPGTHVSFSDRQPEVIGEGGDESDIPACQVIGSWMPGANDPYHQQTGNGGHGGRVQDPPALLKAGPDDSSAAAAVRRAPTRARASTGWQQKRLSMSMEEGLVQAQKDDILDPSAPLLPEPTIPKLDFDFDSIVKPIEDKPYMAAQPDPVRKVSATPSNGTVGSGSGFLAYNPSIRLKPDGAKKTPPEPQPLTESPKPTDEAEDMPDFGASPTSIYSPDSAMGASLHDDTDHGAKLTSFETLRVDPPAAISDDRHPEPPVHGATSPEFEAAEEFFTRMQHMRGTFRLTAERAHNSHAGEAAQWLRASIWWFIKGRFELEEGLRAVQMQAGPNNSDSEGLPLNKQCYIDLTKSWWIMRDILPDHIQAATDANAAAADGLDPDGLTSVFEWTRWEISRFLLSLQRKNLFPPPALLVQGADPEIWVPYPALPAGLYAMAATLNPRTFGRYAPVPSHLAFGMPLGDSDAAFSYGRFFGTAQFIGDPELSGQGGFHCIVSVVRDRADILAEFLIASQDGQLNLHIQSDKRLGPTYADMRWTAQPNAIVVQLASKVKLGIQVREPDFRFLQNVNDYNRMLEVERYAKPDEELLYGDMVRAFHYMGSARETNKSGFPATPVPGCKVRLFQKSVTLTGSGGAEGAVGTGGVRRAFNGYRLTITSPTETKTLSSLTRQLPGTRPILFNNLRGDGGAPALALVLHEDDKSLASLIFTFDTSAKRAAFHTILVGTATSPDECFSEDIPVQSLAVSDTAGQPAPLPQGLQWQRLRIINAGQNLDDAPCLHSDRLRVCISCNYGSLTDRVNLGAGELRIGLDPADTTALRLWRPAQNNLTLAFTEGAVRGKERALLDAALALANSRPSLRTYRFTSLPVLHDFQALVTGFAVVYDGAVGSFAITRRRALVHKHAETDHARLQVLHHTSSADQQGQPAAVLVAFFKDFPAGRCLGLALSPKDAYESSARSGKFYVRFVDARFAMPRPPDEDGADLICLDTPPPPSEHDDLLFGFDSEDERDLFARALPASISKASRMASFRR